MAGNWACLEPLEYWEEFSASSVTLKYNAWRYHLISMMLRLTKMFYLAALFMIIIMYRIKKRDKKNAAAGGETRAML